MINDMRTHDVLAFFGGHIMPIALSTARSAPISSAAYSRSFTPSQQDETTAPVTLTDYLLRIQEYGARLHFTRNETIFNQDDPADQVHRIVTAPCACAATCPTAAAISSTFFCPAT